MDGKGEDELLLDESIQRVRKGFSKGAE